MKDSNAKRDERHIGIERIYKCVHIGRACEKRRIRSARGARSVVAVSHAAVLASDGYPFLHPTLKESEAALARQLADDPQNISSFVATKGLVEGNNSFDDRAYIRLTV